MKGKKIWIAIHPSEPTNFEVEMTEPMNSGVYITSENLSGHDAWVEWQAHIEFEVES